ncbi:MAG TPA: tRNA lysidine(34) synthetase TilS [Xanthobacteraceae bacterium]
MSTAEAEASQAAISDAEADLLLADLIDQPALVLAVSGGPDSTALLWLAAHWRKRQRRGPKLIAVTVDHGLRPEARREAAAVKRLAGRLGVVHRTLRWTGRKPASGLQHKAREARYRLIAAAAARAGATCVVTAHTIDDQAETILFRLARGSGVVGLAGMARVRPLVMPATGVFLVRPLLEVAKSRLVATLLAAKIAAADDASNRDPRFARTRLRTLMPALVSEGLDARVFARLARRVRRADAAIEFAVAAAASALSDGAADSVWPERGPIMFPAQDFAGLPAEVALRLVGRAIAWVGDEGPVELGKLEALAEALAAALAGPVRFRRTLAGALLTLANGRIIVERAPPRRARAAVRAPRARRQGKRARIGSQR